jgi:hypothetical protein
MKFRSITSDGRVSVYSCSVHGEWHLGEGGVRAPGEILPPQDLTETGQPIPLPGSQIPSVL